MVVFFPVIRLVRLFSVPLPWIFALGVGAEPPGRGRDRAAQPVNRYLPQRIGATLNYDLGVD